MTHRQMLIVRVAFACLLSMGMAGSALADVAADVDVQRLTLARDGIFTVLTVHAPGRLLSNHFIEEPKDGKPFRVVLDLCGANHKLVQKNFEQLPSNYITRIRTSQYATMPQNVVRIVLDLAREVTYKVSLEAEAINISLVTPDELVFEPWSSVTSAQRTMYAAGKPAVTASAPPTKTSTDNVTAVAAKPTASMTASAPKQQTPAVMEQKQDTPSIASSRGPYEEVLPSEPVLVANQQPAKSVPPAKTTATEQVNAVVIAPPAESPAEQWDTAKTGTTGEPSVEQVWASAPEIKIELPVEPEQVVEDKPEPDLNKEKPVYVAVVQYTSPIGPLPVEATPPNPAGEKRPIVAETDQANNVGETTESAVAAISIPEEAAPPVQEHVVRQPVLPADEQLPLLARLKKKFLGAPEEEQVQADAASDSSALARIRKLAAAVEEQPIEIPAAEGEAEQASTTPNDSDRSALVDKIATVDPSVIGSLHADTGEGMVGGPTTPPQSGKGTPIEVDRTRKEVAYERTGRRDPFDPLIEGQRSGLWTTALPRVDALRLVGILEDYDGTVALFEDMEGYGYILRQGDPVKNGEVKVIGANRVIFQIDDYGWVHTVTLELQRDASALEPDLATEFEEE